MKCPNCGAENPDYAEYCGKCAQWLKDASGSAVSESARPASVNSHLVPIYGPKTSLRDSPLSLATLALTISLILLSLGFALFVYWNERYLQIILTVPHGLDGIGSIIEIERVSTYVSAFGSISAVLGLVFFVQAFIKTHERDGPSLKNSLAELKGTLWLFVLTAALLTIYTLVIIVASEFRVSIDFRITMRLYYLGGIARLLGVAAFLAFAISFRRAEKTL